MSEQSQVFQRYLKAMEIGALGGWVGGFVCFSLKVGISPRNRRGLFPLNATGGFDYWENFRTPTLLISRPTG